MQSLSTLRGEPAARPAPRAPWSARDAEFQFATDAALERALALALEQPWIGELAVDRRRRTLRVTLSAGTPAVAPGRGREATASLH
jgi:hypothetical protein